jgi:sugar-specific transcriptional regulator TrmB
MNSEKMIRQLEKVGMSNKTATVYLELLRCAGAYPGELTKSTNLNRSTIYKILADLLSRDLVTETEKSKKLYYQAQRPEKLLLDIRTRIKEIQEQYDNAERLVPLLLDMYYENIQSNNEASLDKNSR